MKWIFSGWQFSGITSFVSGAPRGVTLSLTDGGDLTGGGDGTTVVMTGDARTFSQHFDTNVFARPVRGQPGAGAAATKDAFRLPGVANFDFTFFKNFIVKEKVSFQFRWEMYNAFNHTQFSNVDSTAQFDASGRQVNSQFGQITAARDPRIQQLALRVSF